MPEGNSENLSQVREGNFTPASTFLYPLGKKQTSKQTRKTPTKNHSKQNKKSNSTGKRVLRKYIGNTIAKEECKRQGGEQVIPLEEGQTYL